MVREKGSELPIELWHVEQNWLSPDQLDFLHNLGNVKIRYASDHAQYDIKADMLKASVVGTALFYSSFEQILFLSSESLVLQNVDNLFNNQKYLENGALFWPGFS